MDHERNRYFFDGNFDQVTLGKWLGGSSALYFAREDISPGILFNSDNFATSADLVEVCTLLSAVLVNVI